MMELENEAEKAPPQIGKRLAGPIEDVFTAEPERARSGMIEGSKNMEKRRLADTGLTDDRDSVTELLRLVQRQVQG